MIALFILVLSLAAVLEFAISQWRSMWIAAATQPLSESLQAATGISSDAIGADDFELLARTSEQMSPLHPEGNVWLKEVRIYYRVIRTFAQACENQLPALSNWAKGELVACSRYAAAVVDQRLNSNLAYASEIRSF